MKIIQILRLYNTMLYIPGPRDSPHRVGSESSRFWVSRSCTGSLDTESRDPVQYPETLPLMKGEGIKPGTKARDLGPKSGTKFCQQNIAVKHACIELKFGLNVDYRLFFEMHISICLHLPYFYYMQVKYRTMSWNTDPGPTFSVLTMSCNS